jgi:hypothetical protein
MILTLVKGGSGNMGDWEIGPVPINFSTLVRAAVECDARDILTIYLAKKRKWEIFIYHIHDSLRLTSQFVAAISPYYW